MTRPVKLLTPGVEPAPDLPQPFGDKQLSWETRQGHGPGRAAAQSGAGLHKSGVKLAEPVRKDLGFSQQRGVRLISTPDPRAIAGGPRQIGDEIKDLKDALAAALRRIAALERGAGIEMTPEPVAAAPEAADEPDASSGMRWDAPDLSPQQRIDAAMSANLAALNRGGIKSYRR